MVFFFFFMTGCQSSSKLNLGIQSGFEAMNLAAIIAVPVFVQPDPSQEEASIDPSLLVTEKIIPSLEKKIMESFTNQPNVNGYPFSAVKKALHYHENPSEGNSVWNSMSVNLKEIAARFSSRDIKTRLQINPKCLARKNYVEFYSNCVSHETQWLANLNLLSSQVLNADAALITVITELKKNQLPNKQYEIKGGIAVLLVDTNNGNLIWGNDKTETILYPVDKKYFPSWDDILNKILTPNFWNGFPGRIGQNQLNQDEGK